MSEITGLLLAAGQSSRFGSQKLLASIRGRPLIEYSAEALSPCDRVIAVTRVGDQALQQVLLAAGIQSVVNLQAEQGMGRSISCGVCASWQSDAWCILPADMPYVKASTTARVITALRDGSLIAAPFSRGRRGHPVGFSQACRDRLSTLQGEQGGREILNSAASGLTKIRVDDPGVLIDVDTPKDLAWTPEVSN
jgi:molybdenum cofactor cytidylyltransferase